MTEAFFTRDGDQWIPQEWTRGPWDPDAQHGGPPSALLARALEHCEPDDAFHFVRVTIEILRPVPLTPLRVDARVVRGGRSVHLLEGSIEDERGDVMRARAWRLRTADESSVATKEPAPPVPPESAEERPFIPGTRPAGYHVGMDWRFVHGAFRESGPASAWFRMRYPLVSGEEPSPLQRVLIAADSGNGISSTIPIGSHLFINTDLTVHLLRPMKGEWINLDAQTSIAANGVGIAEATLSDTEGRIGQAIQSLFVRARS